jgi:enoyl-CoA hydratase/carnithine racemase
MTTDASPSDLRLVLEGSVAWVIIDNVARANALNSAMWRAIPRCLAEAECNDAIRAIVFRGAGTRAFSAGADISEFESARTGEAARDYDALNDAAFRAITGAAKPTIAMIHGFCMGGGLAIAACCDLRFCDEAAQFAIPAAKLGIGYNQRWVRPLLTLASPPSIKELLYTARRFSAAEGLAMGLVNRIHSAAELETSVRQTAADIAANAPLTIRAAKRAIDELTRRPESADVAALDAAVQACFDSADYVEGRRAFLEKRKPEFRGH